MYAVLMLIKCITGSSAALFGVPDISFNLFCCVLFFKWALLCHVCFLKHLIGKVFLLLDKLLVCLTLCFSLFHSLCLMNLIQTVQQTVRQHSFIRRTNVNMRKEFQLLSNKVGMIRNSCFVALHPRNHLCTI